MASFYGYTVSEVVQYVKLLFDKFCCVIVIPIDTENSSNINPETL